MDPVIIIVKDIKNGKILLTEQELKEIVRRAYNDGYWDGKKTNWWYEPYYYTTCIGGNDTLTTNKTPERYNNITITCDNTKTASEITGQVSLFNDYINSLTGDFMND